MKERSNLNASQSSVSIWSKPEEPPNEIRNSHPFQSWPRLTFQPQSPILSGVSDQYFWNSFISQQLPY
jgi:hypothetical protein